MQIFAQKQNQFQKPASSNVARFRTTAQGRHYHKDPILHSRGAMGNQAAQRMLQQQRAPNGGGCLKCQGKQLGQEHERLHRKWVGSSEFGGVTSRTPGLDAPAAVCHSEASLLKSMPDSALFSATVNADASSGSYAPVIPTHEDDEPTEQYLSNDPPVTIDPPASSEPPASLVPPESAEPTNQAGTGLAKPPALPIIAGMDRTVTAQRGSVPLTTDIFGLTMSEAETVNMNINRLPIIDAFGVSGEMLHHITWNVFEGIGPQNQIDITSKNDPAITAANYRDVARDLRPGQGNIPPREDYFASDLTKRHENFHVYRHRLYYQKGLARGLKWLNAHKARTLGEVQRLVKRMLSRIDKYAGMKTSPNLGSEENDAYEAGASGYQTRSDEILRKGRAGEYP